MHRRRFTRLTLGGAALVLAGPALAARVGKAPTTWDGLVRAPSKKLPLVYLKPGADFRGYKRVMVDPTEVAFRKDWAREYNRRSLSSRVSDAQVEKAVQEGARAATDLFVEAFSEAGYPLAAAPGPDVLRVKTGVFNISVNAPDVAVGRQYSFAQEAGEASLFVEVRDSETGEILGRAVDRQLVGDTLTKLRNRVTNRADFRKVVREWAKTSARGLGELKALSPVSVAAEQGG